MQIQALKQSFHLEYTLGASLSQLVRDLGEYTLLLNIKTVPILGPFEYDIQTVSGNSYQWFPIIQ